MHDMRVLYRAIPIVPCFVSWLSEIVFLQVLSGNIFPDMLATLIKSCFVVSLTWKPLPSNGETWMIELRHGAVMPSACLRGK
jgi:hypothetical protein